MKPWKLMHERLCTKYVVLQRTHAQIAVTAVTFLPGLLNIQKLYNIWVGVVTSEDAED